MGLFDAIGNFFFGEEPSVETGMISRFAPWQHKLGGELGYLLRKRMGKKPEPYKGELPGTAPITRLEQLSLSGLERAFGGEGVVGQAQAALSTAMRGEPVDIGDYFEKTVQAPLVEALREDILPSLRREYAPAFYGSERLKAEERTLEDLADALAAERARMAYQARENALTRALQAAGMVPQTVGLYSTLQELGGLPRDIENEARAARYAEWLRLQKEELTPLEMAIKALAPQAYDPYAVVRQGGPGFLTTAAGGLGQGLGWWLGRRFPLFGSGEAGAGAGAIGAIGSGLGAGGGAGGIGSGLGAVGGLGAGVGSIGTATGTAGFGLGAEGVATLPAVGGAEAGMGAGTLATMSQYLPFAGALTMIGLESGLIGGKKELSMEERARLYKRGAENVPRALPNWGVRWTAEDQAKLRKAIDAAGQIMIKTGNVHQAHKLLQQQISQYPEPVQFRIWLALQGGTGLPFVGAPGDVEEIFEAERAPFNFPV